MVSFSNLTDMLTGRGRAHAEGRGIDPFSDFFSIALLHATIATVGIKGQMEFRAYVLRDARKEELGVFVVQVGARSMSRG